MAKKCGGQDYLQRLLLQRKDVIIGQIEEGYKEG